MYFCHWGCKQTSGAAQLVKRRLEAAGFPTLVLDGDGCDSGNVNDGQMVTRPRPFWSLLEMQMIGYTCKYTPVELLAALGGQPGPFSTGRLTPSPTPRR